MTILCINSGSSSIKAQLIDTESGKVMAKALAERVGTDQMTVTVKMNNESYSVQEAGDYEKALDYILNTLQGEKGVIKRMADIDAVGHRVVHGGKYYSESTLINESVVSRIAECSEYAPLHNPAAVKCIEACIRLMPNTPQVAVFDTAFHRGMDDAHKAFPIPRILWDKIERYGAHGISHQYLTERLEMFRDFWGEEYDVKTIICHLGSGASITAVKNGKCVVTSMGLTPLGGIVMGTRCGDIDPSIPLFMIQNMHMKPDEVNYILNNESGLKALSGISNDFRDVTKAAEEGNEDAKMALNYFFENIAQMIAKYMVTLGGVDNIVFSGGIGENAPSAREGICSKLEFLGIELDYCENQTTVGGREGKISLPESMVDVFVIPTNEELLIAKETERIVNE